MTKAESKQDYDYGLSDYLQLSLWYVLMYALIQWQGWLIGLVLYAGCLHVISIVLKKTMNYEMMGGGDEIFFLDDDRNCLNIVAFHRWEKIKNVEEFRKTML